MKAEEIAKQMYLAYGATTDFKNYQGLPMPEWHNLGDKIRAAWTAAAKRAIELCAPAPDFKRAE